MLKVFKYRIPILDRTMIEMPAGAKLLHVAEQNGSPYLWALVDPDQPPEPRYFRFAGTGHEITDNPDWLPHVGTFFMSDAQLVFHLFEIKPEQRRPQSVRGT